MGSFCRKGWAGGIAVLLEERAAGKLLVMRDGQ